LGKAKLGQVTVAIDDKTYLDVRWECLTLLWATSELGAGQAAAGPALFVRLHSRLQIFLTFEEQHTGISFQVVSFALQKTINKSRGVVRG
jgi:hypothetical protein